jgi:ribosome-binding ATPase YchF (GTP1/OBG family)
MIINDLDFVTKRIERLERDMQLSPKNRLAKEKEMELLQRLRPVLEDERFLRGIAFEEQELLILGSWSLLTLKPGCFVLNVSEKQSAEEVKTFEEDLVNALCGKGDESPVLSINGALESEIAALPPDEARAFMEEYGIAEPGRERIVGAAYALLDLITFFTVSDDECRAWTLRRGGTALEAAGTVHSDLARGFIRAEVIEHDRLVSLGSLAEAKKAGKLRLEGKIYSVKDGEVVHIMFNI